MARRLVSSADFGQKRCNLLFVEGYSKHELRCTKNARSGDPFIIGQRFGTDSMLLVCFVGKMLYGVCNGGMVCLKLFSLVTRLVHVDDIGVTCLAFGTVFDRCTKEGVEVRLL